MKKFISFIIITIISFSSASSTFGMETEGFIERTLQLRTWVEWFNIERAQIDDFNFISPTINSVYTEFKRADRILRDEIMKQYAEWNLEYYQINWMIKNHGKFVYHTNKLFMYLSMKEKWQISWKEADNAIANSYIQLRSYYARLKALYNQ